MPSPDNDSVEAIPLEQFAADCRSLDEADFRRKHGDGFLIHHGLLAEARRPQRPQRTLVFGASAPSGSDETDAHPAVRSASVSHAPAKDILVFPVKNTGRSPYPRIVTVGRTRNNDIVLPDVAMSKFHALFKEEDGRFYVHDAGSRNGTFLDEAMVPDTKRGKPLEVKQGARIRFGAIELWFMRAAGLRDLLAKRLR